MIYGIGTDIVNIQRMQASLTRFGERIAQRLLTINEMQKFRQHTRPAHFLAKRFAVKEAVVKALGIGMQQGISFQDIEVSSTSLGQPNLFYSGKVLAFMQMHQITHSHISIADEQEYAVAYVVLEMRAAPKIIS
jgi:holo-[acyl-carrier protein] synthase